MEKYWKEEDFSNAKERSVFEILREHKGEHIASYYHCCLITLRDFQHPKQISIAAYCLREVMNGLGLVPFDHLSNYIYNLRKNWQPIAEVWSEIDSGEFDENAKSKIMEFLKISKETFNKLDLRPETREQMARVVEEADPSRIGLPPEFSRGISEELVKIRQKVTKILHGKKFEGRSSFMETLEKFEEIIISRYKPRTFEKQAEIDELIREAEAHD